MIPPPEGREPELHDADVLICFIRDDVEGTIGAITPLYCDTLGYPENQIKGLPAQHVFRPHQTDPSEDEELWNAHAQAKAHPGTQVPYQTWIPVRRGSDNIGVIGTIEYNTSLIGWIETAIRQHGPLRRHPPTDHQTGRFHLLGQQTADMVAERVHELISSGELIDSIAERVASLVFREPSPRRGASSTPLFPRDPQEFRAELEQAFEAIGDIEDARPTVEQVGHQWPGKALSDNTVRAAMRFHKIADNIDGKYDYAGPLKRLFNQYHQLTDVAAAAIIVLGCGMHLHMHLVPHMARLLTP